ncbi:MAG: hypothetical protein PHZ02_07260 [Desulfocapsaceae bacterium]|nr:hypothetical protein [Desulfocapsaceae bacterium]
MTTLRQQIITALEDRLKTITVANGYATGVGVSVFIWRKHPVTASETPCLLVQDGLVSREYGVTINKVKNTLTCDILAVASSNATTDDARKMEADLVKCLAAWDTAGGLADRLLLTRSTPVMEQHEKMVGMVHVTVEIVYTTDRDLC